MNAKSKQVDKGWEGEGDGNIAAKCGAGRGGWEEKEEEEGCDNLMK